MAGLSDLSTTPASNTTIGVSVDEGCLPGNLNDAIRDLAAKSKGALLAVTSSGTNTITATYAPVPSAYASGWLYPFKAGGTNTGATTFNANSLGAKTVKSVIGGSAAALTGGEIVSGGFYLLFYDGTDMILVNPSKLTATAESTDYAEGSWTPAVAGSTTAGTQTYSVNAGRYIRVGNIVTAWFQITMTAKDATTAGNVTVTGLPLTSSSALQMGGALSYSSNVTFSTNYTQLGLFVGVSGTSISIQQTGSGQAVLALPASGLSASTSLVGSVTYRL